MFKNPRNPKGNQAIAGEEEVSQKKVPLNVQFVKENFQDFSKGYFLDEMNI